MRCLKAIYSREVSLALIGVLVIIIIVVAITIAIYIGLRVIYIGSEEILK